MFLNIYDSHFMISDCLLNQLKLDTLMSLFVKKKEDQ